MNFRKVIFFVLCMLTARSHAKLFLPIKVEMIKNYSLWGSKNLVTKKSTMTKVRQDKAQTIISAFADDNGPQAIQVIGLDQALLLIYNHLASNPLPWILVSSLRRNSNSARKFIEKLELHEKAIYTRLTTIRGARDISNCPTIHFHITNNAILCSLH